MARYFAARIRTIVRARIMEWKHLLCEWWGKRQHGELRIYAMVRVTRI